MQTHRSRHIWSVECSPFTRGGWNSTPDDEIKTRFSRGNSVFMGEEDEVCLWITRRLAVEESASSHADNRLGDGRNRVGCRSGHAAKICAPTVGLVGVLVMGRCQRRGDFSRRHFGDAKSTAGVTDPPAVVRHETDIDVENRSCSAAAARSDSQPQTRQNRFEVFGKPWILLKPLPSDADRMHHGGVVAATEPTADDRQALAAEEACEVHGHASGERYRPPPRTADQVVGGKAVVPGSGRENPSRGRTWARLCGFDGRGKAGGISNRDRQSSVEPRRDRFGEFTSLPMLLSEAADDATTGFVDAIEQMGERGELLWRR